MNTMIEHLATMVKESMIDFPNKTLPPKVWDKRGNNYTLKKDVKEKILRILKLYDVNILKQMKKIHIVGSICSNQYSEDADVDVHLIPKNANAYDEADVKDIMDWYKSNVDKIGGRIGKHPIEVYLQLNEPQDFLSYGVYDVITDKWLKKPSIVSKDYNPYEDFSDILDDVSDHVEGADKLFGELRRDLIDYDTMKEALQKQSKDNRNAILKHLVKKLNDIEDNIQKLYKERKEWSDIRKSMSSPSSVEQALKDVELIKKWHNTDATFKFINRYKYLQVIGDLYKMIEDDGKITADEVPQVKKVLSPV